jgi:magnesium transporter
MLRLYHKTARSKQIQQLERFTAGTWIYLEKPSEEEISNVVQRFNLDPDLLMDALDPYEVPRYERQEGIIYIYIRIPYKSGEKITTIPLLIALGKNFLLTVCEREIPCLSKVLARKDFYTTQKIYLLLLLLEEIDADYGRFLTFISRGVRSIRIQIVDLDNKDIVKFVNFEEILNDMLSALVPLSSILQRFLFTKSLKLSDAHKEKIEDLYLSAKEWQEVSKTNLKAIVNIRQGYSTIMTNNLNRVIRVLTVLTIILTIPTIVSSMYGMNVALPYAQSPHAFWGVLGGTVIIAVIILIILRWKKWL